MTDSRHVLVATSGYNAHELSLIDLGKRAVVDRQAVRESWFGLAASPRFNRIWWSGGGGNIVQCLFSPYSPCFPEFAQAVRYAVPGTPSELLPLPSALERPHVVEELVIEMEVRELRVWQRNGGSLDQDRDNLGRSRVLSPLSSQGVLDLLGNPL